MSKKPNIKVDRLRNGKGFIETPKAEFVLRRRKMNFTKKEQETFDKMFGNVCDKKTKTNKEKLELLADLLFELTGNVNLRMWLFNLKIKE